MTTTNKNLNKSNNNPDIDKLIASLPPKHIRSHNVVVRVRDVFKQFPSADSVVLALKKINLTLYSGEFVIIYGPSGCGKSTLLHTLLGLENPTGGYVELRDINLYEISPSERSKLRHQKLGMVFQQNNWIKSLKVWENVAYPLYLTGYNTKDAKEKAIETLKKIELDSLSEFMPNELSGGQQQRIALARALVTEPWILIADEPTGNLDSHNSLEIIKIFTKLNREEHRMIIMVTHDLSFLPLANRRISMKDGLIISDEHD